MIFQTFYNRKDVTSSLLSKKIAKKNLESDDRSKKPEKISKMSVCLGIHSNTLALKKKPDHSFNKPG